MLKCLHLDNNLLVVCPDISKMILLEQFYIGKNKLKVLPDCIGDLPNLQILSIENNKFSNLPDRLSMANNLKELYVCNNLLTSLSFLDGILLKVLDCGYNKLSSVNLTLEIDLL